MSSMRNDSTFGPSRARGAIAAGMLVLAVFAMGTTITWAFRSMRAVMDAGGSCASGGPYVPARPCPDGTWMIPVAIMGLVLASIIGTALAVVLRAPALLPVMWAALFGSLGWNFLEYGLRPEGNAGLIVCGIVFWLMALPAVLLIVFSGALATRFLPSRTRARASVAASLRHTCSWLLGYAAVGAAGARLGWSWWEMLV